MKIGLQIIIEALHLMAGAVVVTPEAAAGAVVPAKVDLVVSAGILDRLLLSLVITTRGFGTLGLERLPISDPTTMLLGFYLLPTLIGLTPNIAGLIISNLHGRILINPIRHQLILNKLLWPTHILIIPIHGRIFFQINRLLFRKRFLP